MAEFSPKLGKSLFRMSQLSVKKFSFFDQFGYFSIMQLRLFKFPDSKICFLPFLSSFFKKDSFFYFRSLISSLRLEIERSYSSTFLLSYGGFFLIILDLVFRLLDFSQNFISTFSLVCKFQLTIPFLLKVNGNLIQERF